SGGAEIIPRCGGLFLADGSQFEQTPVAAGAIVCLTVASLGFLHSGSATLDGGFESLGTLAEVDGSHGAQVLSSSNRVAHIDKQRFEAPGGGGADAVAVSGFHCGNAKKTGGNR